MRQIKAKDIKPGMTIRWGYGDVSYQCPLAGVERFNNDQDVQGETPQGKTVLIGGDDDVLVVKEPPQSEEPTEFGARVVVNGRRFLRAPLHSSDLTPWLSQLDGRWRDWPMILAMGPVTVVPDQGWTVPADTPEVPERIEEWDTWEDVPEGVAVTNPGLRYRYRKAGGKTEVLAPRVLAPVGDAEWIRAYVSMESQPGPWTRVTDA